MHNHVSFAFHMYICTVSIGWSLVSICWSLRVVCLSPSSICSTPRACRVSTPRKSCDRHRCRGRLAYFSFCPNSNTYVATYHLGFGLRSSSPSSVCFFLRLVVSNSCCEAYAVCPLSSSPDIMIPRTVHTYLLFLPALTYLLPFQSYDPYLFITIVASSSDPGSLTVRVVSLLLLRSRSFVPPGPLAQ